MASFEGAHASLIAGYGMGRINVDLCPCCNSFKRTVLTEKAPLTSEVSQDQIDQV